jgi:hypothetical protein
MHRTLTSSKGLTVLAKVRADRLLCLLAVSGAPLTGAWLGSLGLN